MNDWIAVSVIGRDRPGIVASVSRVLYQSHCNIEELTQAAIRGQFAMILIASTSRSEALSGLKAEFAGLAADPQAGQQWRDLFTRLRRPSEVFTAERLTRWAAAGQDHRRAREGAPHG